jgi:hypothetical protein
MGDERKGRSGFGRAFCLAAAVGVSGCSFVLVPIPPSAPEERTPKAAEACSTSTTVPVVDAALSGIGVFYTVSGAASSDNEPFLSPLDTTGTIALGVTTAALYGASAAFGFLSVSRCGELREEVKGRAPNADDGAPGTSAPPAPSASVPAAPIQEPPSPPESAPSAAPVSPPPPPPVPSPQSPPPSEAPPAPADPGPTKSFPVD